jgi:hypothetical protein
MKITKHISFFYSPDRICYINKIIDKTNYYKFITDIFIHTNSNNLKTDLLNTYTNGSINIIIHDLSKINPFYLTWKCRDLLLKQIDEYDIFMYIEDDILVPSKAIEYWLDYNEQLIEMNLNLGFLRVEINNNEEYVTDLYGEKFDSILNINNTKYCINNKNPYCAFWIYNKKEFNKFVESKYYNISNISEYELYGIREKSGVGLHGIEINWYRGTIIPIIGDKLIESCKIYHLKNNYVVNNETLFSTIKFNDAISNSVSEIMM